MKEAQEACTRKEAQEACTRKEAQEAQEGRKEATKMEKAILEAYIEKIESTRYPVKMPLPQEPFTLPDIITIEGHKKEAHALPKHLEGYPRYQDILQGVMSICSTLPKKPSKKTLALEGLEGQEALEALQAYEASLDKIGMYQLYKWYLIGCRNGRAYNIVKNLDKYTQVYTLAGLAIAQKALRTMIEKANGDKDFLWNLLDTLPGALVNLLREDAPSTLEASDTIQEALASLSSKQAKIEAKQAKVDIVTYAFRNVHRFIYQQKSIDASAKKYIDYSTKQEESSKEKSRKEALKEAQEALQGAMKNHASIITIEELLSNVSFEGLEGRVLCLLEEGYKQAQIAKMLEKNPMYINRVVKKIRVKILAYIQE